MLTNLFKKTYIRITGYSYTHMGRLFLRLFVGIMLAQFGIRQWMHFDEACAAFPSVCGMSPSTGLIFLIIIEIVCSFFIMCGFLTRVMVIPPFITMIVAQCYLISHAGMPSYLISWVNPAYVPMMFLGIYFFILLVGPGKISIDYFLSLYFIHSSNKSESELEEV